MSSSSDLLASPPKAKRLSTMAGNVRPTVVWGAVILCTGILIAALTTTDPIWWHLHFSRLGMFANFSGATFNGGVVLSGAVIAAASVPLAVHLEAGLAAGRIRDPRSARMLPPLLIALGASLSTIGIIPLTLNEFLHDRAANGVLLSFLGLVIFSRRTLPELPRFLARSAIVAIVLLSVGIALMVTGIINLAAFEVLAFGSVLSWVHLLERSIARLGAAPAVAPVAESDTAELPAPRRHTDTIARGARRRLPASVGTPRVRAAALTTSRVDHPRTPQRWARGRTRSYSLARQRGRAGEMPSPLLTV